MMTLAEAEAFLKEKWQPETLCTKGCCLSPATIYMVSVDPAGTVHTPLCDFHARAFKDSEKYGVRPFVEYEWAAKLREATWVVEESEYESDYDPSWWLWRNSYGGKDIPSIDHPDDVEPGEWASTS